MKNSFGFILIILIAFSISACTSSKHATVKRRPKDVNRILLFQPLSAVYVIEKGNKLELDVNYSDLMMYNTWDGLEDLLPYELNAQKIEADSIEQTEISKELYELGIELEKKIIKKGIPVSDKLITALDKHNYKYAIGTICYGFTRTRQNYNKQAWMGVGIALLSAGISGGAFSMTYMPYKSNSTIVCFIIDKENKNIAYYRKYSLNNEDPINWEVTEIQLRSILNTYFGSSVVATNSTF